MDVIDKQLTESGAAHDPPAVGYDKDFAETHKEHFHSEADPEFRKAIGIIDLGKITPGEADEIKQVSLIALVRLG